MNRPSPLPPPRDPRLRGEGTSDDDPETGPSRRIAALFGLALIVLLVVAAIYLVRALQRESQLEDCLMAHRINCAPIAVPARGSQ